ncbi:DUF1198 family protein [Shigella flexneri]
MVNQMGKSAGDEFLRYLHRPDESHLQNAAQVLFHLANYRVDGSEQNLLQWHRIFAKKLASPRRLPTLRSGSRWVFCTKPN